MCSVDQASVCDIVVCGADWNSYEGLPPNFSLLQNMTAGAFAGIAVSSILACKHVWVDVNEKTGAHGYVPH